MSCLSSALKSVIRPKVSECILNRCLPTDRVVVDNILTVTQDLIPFVDITSMSMDIQENTYCLKIPLTDHVKIFLRDLRAIEAYSPARISSISVSSTESGLHLLIHVANEQVSVRSTLVDVIRVTKRRYES
jgi:hypothetical protein